MRRQKRPPAVGETEHAEAEAESRDPPLIKLPGKLDEITVRNIGSKSVGDISYIRNLHNF